MGRSKPLQRGPTRRLSTTIPGDRRGVVLQVHVCEQFFRWPEAACSAAVTELPKFFAFPLTGGEPIGSLFRSIDGKAESSLRSAANSWNSPRLCASLG